MSQDTTPSRHFEMHPYHLPLLQVQKCHLQMVMMRLVHPIRFPLPHQVNIAGRMPLILRWGIEAVVNGQRQSN